MFARRIVSPKSDTVAGAVRGMIVLEYVPDGVAARNSTAVARWGLDTLAPAA
jgi:hypothetical protein